ncbi:unnamed protein product, partial [Schistosoma mattheei]
NIEAAPTDLAIDVGPPTIEEISIDIRQIRRSGNCKDTPHSLQQNLE